MSEVEIELTPAEEGLIITSGETSTGLSIEGGNYVEVLSGGTLKESLIKDASFVVVEPGGVVQDIAMTGFGEISLGGDMGEIIVPVPASATNLTVDNGGRFTIDRNATLNSASIQKDGLGTVNPGVSAADVSVTGGTFMVGGGTAARTTVGDGGIFKIETFKAQDEQIFTGLAQSATILDGGRMEVLNEAVAQDTVMSGGEFIVSSGSASNTTVTGGTMTVLVGVPVQDTVLNGGKLIVSHGSATNTTVNEGAAVSAFGGEIMNTTVAGGELWATDADIFDLTVNAGSVALEASLLGGKAVFAEGTSVTVDGTIWFDTQYVTSTEAQIKGAFTASSNSDYMLTAEPVIGIYLLADNVPDFNSGVLYEEYTLKLGEDPVVIDGLDYSLILNGTALQLSIAEHTGDATLLYVNSEWSTLISGSTVIVGGITATIGTNAFALGDDAATAAKEIENAKIRITGGIASFTDPIAIDTSVYDGAILVNSDVAATGTLVLNSGATITGKSVFAEGASITVNGMFEFDTQYVTKDDASSVQFVFSGAPAGSASYTLKATSSEIGTYRLLSGIPSFAGKVAFNDSTLTVGGGAVEVDGLDYALSLAGEQNDVLVLTISEHTDTSDPVITVTPSETEPTCEDVIVTATFTDDSGLVPLAQYKIVKQGEEKDLIPWSDYVLGGATVTENNTTVFFRAEDAAGNKAEEQYTVTNIDRSLDVEPPTLLSVSADTEEPTDHVVVTAEFTDNVSVASTQYKFGETGEWSVTPGGNVSVTVTQNITVYFQAFDEQNNASEIVGYQVTNIIDTEAPVLISITADPAALTNRDVVVVAAFSDNSGEEPTVKYKLVKEDQEKDKIPWTVCQPGGVTVAENNTTVYFQASDASGNLSEEAVILVDFIDKVPPDPPVATASTTDPTDEPVTVTAHFSGDSVRQEYQVNGGKWRTYPDGGVTLTKNGAITFRGTDAAGNESVTEYVVSNIEGGSDPGDDIEAPTLLYVKANITKPTNKNVTVMAAFEDNVGVKTVKYKIGEEAEWTIYPDGGVLVTGNDTVFFKATDDAGNVTSAQYEVKNIDKALPDGQAVVYVDVNWAGAADQEPVDLYDYGAGGSSVIGTATFGVDAFVIGADADAAVDGEGMIHLKQGSASFTSPVHNIIVSWGATLILNNDADAVNVLNGGVASMTSNTLLTNGIVSSGGMLVADSRTVLDGLQLVGEDAFASISGGLVKNASAYGDGGKCDLTISGDDGLVQGATVTSGGRLTVISGAQAENVTLAGDCGMALFGGLFVTLGGAVSGVTVSSGGSAEVNALLHEEDNKVTAGAVMNDFTVLEDGYAKFCGMTASGSNAVVNGGQLVIVQNATFTGATVGANGAVQTENSAGSGCVYDTVVQAGGRLDNWGYASNTQVQNGGAMVVWTGSLAEDTAVETGGILNIFGALTEETQTVSCGVVSNVTVENGALVEVQEYGKLTGKVTMVTGATVTMKENSVLDFDISGLTGKEKTPLVNDYSIIGGTPGLTLTVSPEQAEGLYLLAGGAASFEGSIALGGNTLTVGGEPVEYGGTTYSLNLSGDTLTLTVGNYVPPTLPDIVYVNDEWALYEEGTLVEIGGITATVGYDAFATGDAAVDFIGGDTSVPRDLVFFSNGSAATLVGFTGITVDADYLVTLGGAFTGTAITIDATDYANFTKKVVYSEGGYAEGVVVSVIGETGYSFYDDKTLLVVSSLVRDTFANTDWTAEDVENKFSEDGVALVWNKNAFNSFAAAAAALGSDGTLYIEGGTSSEPVTLTGPNDVVVSANTTGTVAGAITGAGGAFTVKNDLIATSISGFSSLTVQAGTLSVSEGISLTVDGMLVFDISKSGGGDPDPLIENLSVFSGTPDLVLSVSSEQAEGTYRLAGGVESFDGRSIALGDYSLTVGGEPVQYGYAFYTLALDDTTLVLNVETFIPPTKLTVYVDSAWDNVAEGAVVPAFVDADGEIVTDAVKGVNAFATGDAAALAVTEEGKIEVVGGEVSFTNPVTAPLLIDASATLTGKATFEVPVTINGGLVFDAELATEGAQFTGFDKVTLGDDAHFSLSLGELPIAAGEKIALTDAPTVKTDKNRNPLYGKKVSVLGENDYEIGSACFDAISGVSYVLDLDKKGELVLSAVEQRLRNNDNDNLIVSKQPDTHVIGEDVPYTILTLENPEVFVDPEGEIKQEFAFNGGKTYYNYVDGTSDKIDYAQIVVEHGAKLVFTLEATDKAKITLYSVSANAKGQWSKKTLKSASLTKSNGSKNTAAVYVTGGTYYVAVSNSNKKTSGAFYNVTLNTVSSYIYADADDNWNDYLVKSKALNPDLADFMVTEITESTDPLKPLHVLFDNAPLTLSEDYDNFVGYTDTVDFAKLSTKQPVGLTFTLQTTGKATLTVYKLTLNSKGVWTQSKALKTVKVTAAAGGEKSGTVLYLDRLVPATGAEATGYYVSVKSTNAKGNVNYTVLADAKVFEDSDFGTNGVLLVDKYTVNDKLASTTISAEKTPITTEVINGEDDIAVSKEFNDKTYTSFVGLGDQYDYAEVVLNGTGNITLSLETYGTVKSTAKMMLYKLTLNSKGVWSKSTVGTLSVKTDGIYGVGEGSKTIKIKAASSDTVKYYVGVQSVDAAKGKEMYYNACATFDGASSSALDMPQDDLLSIQSFDSLADSSAFVDSSPVDDKQFALQSVPGLIA